MDTTDKIDELCNVFNQIVNQYGTFEKETRYYGIDIPLHLSETHTIVAIGNHTNINIVNLSQLQGISRSAVSQMVSKLVKKGFIKKQVSPKTNNEILLTLTEIGEKVYHAHNEQHRWLKEKLTDIFDKYSDHTIDILIKIGTDVQGIWDML